MSPTTKQTRFACELKLDALEANTHTHSSQLAAIKKKITTLEEVPADQQRLIYQGTQLDDVSEHGLSKANPDFATAFQDTATLESLKVPEAAMFHLVLKLRGT